jgi:NADH-quinone oxidoreductase subunit G
MFTIYIDNKPYQVQEGRNLLSACLSLGFDLPYFCWHPAMHSVGACRQCAVKQFKDEKDARGRIVMSCMTPVAEGMRISIDDPEAKAFRASVIEWLMVNHPHDCPVCDEGGECHLQDMTVMTGHNYRRTRFKKRTHRNQNLGPFVNHEMNRCIACYRCVRFYRDYAGGRDLDVFASHDHVYFGRREDGVLESEFSGNLVEVCPTGVFTDKTLKRHYTRKWDLQTAPSICVHCGLGCNTLPGERYGSLRRVLNRYHHEVNGYFLCDRGRFGYEFVNSGRRIRKALLKAPSPQPSPAGGEGIAPPFTGGVWEGWSKGLQPVSKETALSRISNIMSKSTGVIGIGSPRASLESNVALRSLVGPDNFYSGMSAREHSLVSLIIDILQKGPARSPSLHDVEMADAVLVLGEDVTNTAPLLDLALRQAVRNKPKEMSGALRIPEWDDNAVRNLIQDARGPLYVAAITDTKLDDLAAKSYHAAPDDIARLGFAVAHELNSNSPAVPGISDAKLPENPPQSPFSKGGPNSSPPFNKGGQGGISPGELLSLAKEIAQALKNARRPLVVSGIGCLSEAVIQAAANIAWALSVDGKPAGLSYAVHECNTMGVGLMGGRNIDELPTTPAAHRGEGKSEGNKFDTVIILENDLYRRADEKIVNAFFSGAKHVIVIDHLINPTSSKAEVALPAGTFAESDGTLVNNEGRAQRFYQVFTPNHDIQESWRWIHDIMISIGKSASGSQQSFDDIIREMISSLPIFALIKDGAPSADFRINGAKIPRQPHRYSGCTAMLANISVHEPKPPQDPDTPLSFSMEGYEGRPPAELISRYWSPGWNSVQALNKFQQEVDGPLRGGDPGKRLIEPKLDARSVYFTNIPSPSKLKPGDASLPRYSIFGSEELSSYSPAVLEAGQLKRNKDASS